jgi:hypothetical protein
MADIDLNHIVLQYAIRVAQYERANPDVGMGPQPAWMLDRALNELGIPRDGINYDATLDVFTAHCNKHNL